MWVHQDDNIGKSIWDKVRCYWERVKGTHLKPGEHVENPLGTPQKIQQPLPPSNGLG